MTHQRRNHAHAILLSQVASGHCFTQRVLVQLRRVNSTTKSVKRASCIFADQKNPPTLYETFGPLFQRCKMIKNHLQTVAYLSQNHAKAILLSQGEILIPHCQTDESPSWMAISHCLIGRVPVLFERRVYQLVTAITGWTRQLHICRP